MDKVPIMGLESYEELGIVKRVNNIKQTQKINEEKELYIKKYKECFTGTGRFSEKLK